MLFFLLSLSATLKNGDTLSTQFSVFVVCSILNANGWNVEQEHALFKGGMHMAGIRLIMSMCF